MFSEIKGQWRVVLVTLLAANLVFMALLQLQRLEISRIFQKPSTEKIRLPRAGIGRGQKNRDYLSRSHLRKIGRAKHPHRKDREGRQRQTLAEPVSLQRSSPPATGEARRTPRGRAIEGAASVGDLMNGGLSI